MPLNVRDFPRPPALEQVTKRIQIIWRGHVVADTQRAWRVLETFHPPTYYIPRSDIQYDLHPTARQTFCEWKGVARYFSLVVPAAKEGTSTTTSTREADDTLPAGAHVSDRAWTVPAPTAGFESITDHVAFYVGPWECWVDGERARPQPGRFYAGWVTDDIVGPIKGAPGTTGW